MKKRYLITCRNSCGEHACGRMRKEELCGTGAEGGGNGDPDGDGSSEDGCGGDADLYGRNSKYQERDGNQERDHHQYCVHQ